mgnify:CR=1 FL=1
MAKVLKELENLKSDRLEQQNQVVDSARLLLAQNESEERSVLHGIGLDMELTKAEDNIELSILNKNYSDKYGVEIYHIDELRKLGMKYRLFMKPAFLYRGTIPPDLGSLLNRFVKEHNLYLSQESKTNDANRFLIMAPPRMFKDYKPIHKKIRHMIDESYENFQKMLKAPVDPLLFYRVDNTHYALLKKWGNDLSLTRRVLGFLTQSKFLPYLSFLVPFILMTVYWIKSMLYILNDLSISSGNLKELTVIGIFCVGISLIIFYVVIFGKIFWGKRQNNAKEFTTQYHWNSDIPLF